MTNINILNILCFIFGFVILVMSIIYNLIKEDNFIKLGNSYYNKLFIKNIFPVLKYGLNKTYYLLIQYKFGFGCHSIEELTFNSIEECQKYINDRF
jgi:hypothetical protein